MRIHKSLILISILYFLLVSGCSSSLVNLKTYKQKIISYYESGQHDTEVREVIKEAISELKGEIVRDSSAVVFDIDETALNNYEHIKKNDFGYNSAAWHNWVMEKKAPAIQGVKDFYNFLIDRRVKVIFVTGRSAKEYDATIENLKSVGYTQFDTLIVRSESNKNAPASNYKSIERMVLSGLGYKIIACIGDQESDLTGAYTGLKIKIPNYLYIIE